MKDFIKEIVAAAKRHPKEAVVAFIVIVIAVVTI